MWREDREIRLFPRVLTLNDQEAASSDIECVRVFVDHLALGRRGTAQ